MPRFYFDIRNDLELTEDPEGIELRNATNATQEIEDGAREILA